MQGQVSGTMPLTSQYSEHSDRWGLAGKHPQRWGTGIPYVNTHVSNSSYISMPVAPIHSPDQEDIKQKSSSTSSKGFGNIESASTWPSISKSSLITRKNHIFALFAALLLSTTLALFSALDAALNCTRGTNIWSFPTFGKSRNQENDEGEYYYNYGNNGRKLEDYYQYSNNDDYYSAQLSQAEECKDLFVISILPVCPIIIVICLISCRRTIDNQDLKKETDDSDRNIPESISFSEEEDRDSKRFGEFQAHVDHQAQHLKSCFLLLFNSFICMGLWIYAKIMISNESNAPMLDDDGDKNLFKLQFQSLGAINYIGEVGQNANLYYSSWFSVLTSVALVYELGRITSKHYHATQNIEAELERITSHRVTQTNAIEIVMTWSKAQQQLIQDKRSAWHESLYKLRFRTGIWLTALIASILLFTSSRRVWNNDIYPTALANGEIGDDGIICTIFEGYISLQSRDDMGFIHPSECERTKAAKTTGIFCIGLSMFALVAHYNMHSLVAQEIRSSSKLLRNREDYGQILEKRRKLIPLRLECIFACIISFVLAINALFATAVEGPASKVGDLYYSSWIAFVSATRLALNCVEDILEENQEILEENLQDPTNVTTISETSNTGNRNTRRHVTRLYSMNNNFSLKKVVSTRLVMLAPTQSSDDEPDEDTIGSFIGGMPIPKKNGLHQMFEELIIEDEEASRSKRVLRWASGCIFSTIYLMSALDAAFHTSLGELDMVQMYMVICPSIFATLCLLMFCMCLKTNTYQIVDKFKVGGVLSIFLLFSWTGNLILTLHSKSSWAVNEIGEVKMANLYYFTWATVLNTGLLVSSYLKKLLSNKSKPVMVVLWLAVAKICFVMCGSCCDILHNIQDQCQAATHGDETATFCERTVAGAIVGFVGMAAGFFAAVFRYFYPDPIGNNQRLEAAMAATLTVLFALSLALITGIGGPGQTVGDLYYGSWLAFLASLGVTTSLCTNIQKSNGEGDGLVCSTSSESAMGASLTPYSVRTGQGKYT